MNYKFILYLHFLLFYLAGHLESQTTPYNFGDFPAVFSTLENQLAEEEIDSVLTLCAAILKRESDTRIMGIAQFYQGQAEALIRRFDRAAASYQDALQSFTATNYKKGLAVVYLKMGDIAYFERDFTQADSLYGLSVAVAKAENVYDILVDAYQKKATIYANGQEPQLAIEFLKISLQYAQLQEDGDQVKNLLNQISTNYQAHGQLDSAILYFQKTLRWKQALDDQEGLISDYSALGNLYRERGDYEEAQQHLIAALKIAENERDSFSLATIHSEIGDVYAAQNSWNSAEKYYQSALLLARLKNSQFAEAGCLKKLGKLYAFQNRDTAAVEHYEAALEIYEQLHNKINAADVLISLSKVYQDGDQFAKAKTLLLEALAARRYSPDKLSTLSTKIALAEIEISHGDLRKGTALVEECLPLYQEMEDKEGLRQSYLLLAQAYAKAGNFKKAYDFHRYFTSTKDSLTSIERTKVINELEMRYTTEKKDKEIAEQKIEIEKQRTEIQIRNNQLLLLAGGLVVIGLFTALLFFINRKNRQLDQQRIQVLKKEQETQRLKAVIEGEEKERKRIARELHDGLGAVLATVKMAISSIQHKLPSVQSLPTYQKTETLIDDACRTVREISHNLMPHVLEQQGLESAIDDLCQTLANNNEITVDFNYYGDEGVLSDVLKTTIFRITQELLKNMIKHAEAKEVIVQLTIEENELMLIVEDDGKGFDSSLSYQGIGLENIRSRTAYLDGTLEIDSRIGQGSTFTVCLPLKPRQ